jgi:hypothetical protein
MRLDDILLVGVGCLLLGWSLLCAHGLWRDGWVVERGEAKPDTLHTLFMTVWTVILLLLAMVVFSVVSRR